MGRTTTTTFDLPTTRLPEGDSTGEGGIVEEGVAF
jgi:hypothetical protein